MWPSRGRAERSAARGAESPAGSRGAFAQCVRRGAPLAAAAYPTPVARDYNVAPTPPEARIQAALAKTLPFVLFYFFRKNIAAYRS